MDGKNAGEEKPGDVSPERFFLCFDLSYCASGFVPKTIVVDDLESMNVFMKNSELYLLTSPPQAIELFDSFPFFFSY